MTTQSTPEDNNQNSPSASTSSASQPPANQGLGETLVPFAGLRGDLARRLPVYIHDFTHGFHPKVLASILFLFFACLANAIAFGGLTELVTGGAIGTVEMIVATAVGGIAFAIFSGQPLIILGGTGPIVIFTGILYASCEQFGLPFLPVYAWVGLWSGAFLVLLSIFNLSYLMREFTRFTDEIFAALIAVIFIVEAAKNTASPFMQAGASDATQLLTLVLALGTFSLARGLRGFGATPYASKRAREFISDFGPAIAIAVMTGFAIYEGAVAVEMPAVPDEFATTTGRPWKVDLFSIPVPIILGSAIPALMATILLFLDENITARLVNAPGHKLTKGAGYHLDLLVVGLITIGCSLFGLPWIVAATVHAINHVKSLADTKKVDIGAGQHVEVITKVRQTRLSGLGIHALIAGSIFFLPLIKMIPMAVLFGLFLYMGFATLTGNQFWSRVTLWVTDRGLYPDTHYLRGVPNKVIHKFTVVQVVALTSLWVLKTSALGILFPALIAALAFVRKGIGRWFKEEHLNALDADEAVDEADSGSTTSLAP